MRPSKFLLPERTAATTRSFSSTAAEISSASGPELPMHVVQPYPTTSNFSFSSGSRSPEVCRYSVTTLDPGARLVLTCGATESPFSTAFLANRPAPIITEGLEVLVQLVMAAMTAEPCVRESSSPSTVTVMAPVGSASGLPFSGSPPDVGSPPPSLLAPETPAGVSLAGKDSVSSAVWLSPVETAPPTLPSASLTPPRATGMWGVGVHHLGQSLPEGGLHVVEGDPVLRAAWPGQARLDRIQLQIQDLREARFGRLVRAPEALLLAVGLDQLDELLVAARAAQVAERLGVHGEERARRPELGGHVRDGGPVGQRELAQSLAVELHELADDALGAQHLCNGQDEVRGRDALS